jgi:Plasmid stabilisation system protein.
MNQYLVSDTARSDLDEIWFYIAQDNPDAADKFMRALVSKYNQDDATGFIRLNALRLKVAAKAQRNKQNSQ